MLAMVVAAVGATRGTDDDDDDVNNNDDDDDDAGQTRRWSDVGHFVKFCHSSE